MAGPFWRPSKPPKQRHKTAAEQMHDILPPLLLGSLITAIALALIANVAIRLIWRWHVSHNWKRRRLKRRRRRACIESQFDD